MKLTNIQVVEYIKLKHDIAGSPEFDEKEISDLFNESYLEWIDERLRAGESSERNVSLLSRLVRKKDYGSTRRLRLSLIDPAPLRIWTVLSNFNYECKGVVSKYTRPVTPKEWDKIGVTMDNPFERPDDWFPYYTQVSEGGEPIIDIYSTTVPLESEITYVKTPEPFDAVNDPDGLTEVGLTAQYQIADIVLQKMSVIVQDAFRTQAVSQTEVAKN